MSSPLRLPEAVDVSALVGSQRWTCAVRLMDSLVHDVRNPLNALAINVEILREKLARAAGGEVPAGQSKNLVAMREQIARVNGLLGDFARFLAAPPSAPAAVSLAQVVREATSVLGHASRRARVQLGMEVEPGEATVNSPDPATLNFLVLRPVLRGLERTPEDGQVRVTLHSEGGRVVLHVQDGGAEDADETEVEHGIRVVAKAQGAEFHVRGSQLRLSFRAA